VSHVDHAHQAEGDGEAERREQEHAAEAQAVDQVACDAHEQIVPFDRGDRGAGGGSHARIGFGEAAVGSLPDEGLQLRPERGIRDLGDRPDRAQARARIGAAEIEPCQCERQQSFDPRVGLARERLPDRRHHLGARRVRNHLGRLQPDRRVARAQRQLCDRRPERAPDTVGHQRLRERAGCDRRPARERIAQTLAVRLLDQHVAARGDAQSLVLERLQDHERRRLLAPAERHDRILHRLVVAAELRGERLHALRVRARREAGCDQNDDQPADHFIAIGLYLGSVQLPQTHG
jgi:hypothetical protein